MVLPPFSKFFCEMALLRYLQPRERLPAERGMSVLSPTTARANQEAISSQKKERGHTSCTAPMFVPKYTCRQVCQSSWRGCSSSFQAFVLQFSWCLHGIALASFPAVFGYKNVVGPPGPDHENIITRKITHENVTRKFPDSSLNSLPVASRCIPCRHLTKHVYTWAMLG